MAPPESCVNPAGAQVCYYLGMSALYPTPNALYVLLKTLSIPNSNMTFSAFIDSSSSHSFINPQFVAVQNLHVMLLDTKIMLHLFDGSCNSALNSFVNLEILLPIGENQQVTFHVTNLGG